MVKNMFILCNHGSQVASPEAVKANQNQYCKLTRRQTYEFPSKFTCCWTMSGHSRSSSTQQTLAIRNITIFCVWCFHDLFSDGSSKKSQSAVEFVCHVYCILHPKLMILMRLLYGIIIFTSIKYWYVYFIFVASRLHALLELFDDGSNTHIITFYSWNVEMCMQMCMQMWLN